MTALYAYTKALNLVNEIRSDLSVLISLKEKKEKSGDDIEEIYRLSTKMIRHIDDTVDLCNSNITTSNKTTPIVAVPVIIPAITHIPAIGSIGPFRPIIKKTPIYGIRAIPDNRNYSTHIVCHFSTYTQAYKSCIRSSSQLDCTWYYDIVELDPNNLPNLVTNIDQLPHNYPYGKYWNSVYFRK